MCRDRGGTCRAAAHVGPLQDILPKVALAVGGHMEEIEKPVEVLQAPAHGRSCYAPPAEQTHRMTPNNEKCDEGCVAKPKFT